MNDITTIFALIGAITAVATAVAAWAAYYLVQRQWRSDALHREHIELLKPDVREALRTVFAAQPEEFLERDDIRLLNAAEKVLDMYDLIGHRLSVRAIPRGATVESEWPTVLRIAQQLKMFIDKTAAERQTDYKEGFRLLVREIIKTPRIAKKVGGGIGRRLWLAYVEAAAHHTSKGLSQFAAVRRGGHCVQRQSSPSSASR